MAPPSNAEYTRGLGKISCTWPRYQRLTESTLWALGSTCAGEGNDNTCEFAITVAEDWRGIGLATRLLASLVRRARRDGYETMEAWVIARNTPMLAVARKLPFQGRARVGGCHCVAHTARAVAFKDTTVTHAVRCLPARKTAVADHPRIRGARLLQCPDTAGKCRADLTLINSVHSAEA